MAAGHCTETDLLSFVEKGGLVGCFLQGNYPESSALSDVISQLMIQKPLL
jgi:hypothetical protein